VKTVDVFIYTSNGTFSSHTPLTAADFNPVGSTGTSDAYEYVAQTKIPTTTGSKSIFVGINLPADVVSAVKNDSESVLFSTVQTMSRENLTGSSGFVMFSTEPVHSTFVEDENSPSNKVSVKCQRLVAKVTVETTANVDTDAIPGTLSNLSFAINNFNTKLFLMQGPAQFYKDPNWTTFAPSDFISAASGDYVPVLSRALIANPGVNDYNPRYAAENTSEKKTKAEITRATVRAEFIPEKIVKYANGLNKTDGFVVDDNHGVVIPQDFWVITPSVLDGSFYFFDLNVAFDFADANRDSNNQMPNTFKYDNGYCYWHIYLNKNPLNLVNRWDVLRNDFYKCIITKISGIGRNTPDITDPEDKETPDVDTSITVDIEILFWNTPIESNYILE
jgi:hypothetical protein